MSKFILAHDLGTTGNKATLYNEHGQLLNSCLSEYETHYSEKNQVEQNPADWWRAVCKSTKELVANSKIDKNQVAVISFSGQMMGCLPVDREGIPLRNSIIWADQRSVQQAEVLNDLLGMDKVYNITGHRISSTYSLAKIMWVKENEPQIYKNTHRFLHAKDFIVCKLTGEFVTDYSDASGMNLFDLNDRSWSQEIIEKAEIHRSKLPEVRPSSKIIGEISSCVADEIGLEAGTPVVIGAGDGACATVGAGVIEEGSAYNYIGSSSWIAMSSQKPVLDADHKTFNWIHMDPDKFIPCGTMQSAGASYSWLRDNICIEEKELGKKLEIDSYDLMNLQVEKSEPTAHNLIFLPYLMGERSPHWNPEARGAFIGLSMKHDRSDIIRSVMEGVTFNLKIICDIIEKNQTFKKIRVIGGGAKSQTWCKIMADIYNKTVLKPCILEEATSLGAAVAGGIGAGIFGGYDTVKEINKIQDKITPEKSRVEKYREFFPVFKKSYQALCDVYSEIAE